MTDIKKITRKNIEKLTPYSSARDEFKETDGIFLDANENSIGSLSGDNLNRYPDPHQLNLKREISKIYQINSENIFLGNGSDEVIDLLVRAFCEPKIDKIMLFPPTYGMYKVVANINDITIIEIPLTDDFQLQTDKIISKLNENIKLIFICSPNNPSGNSFHKKDIIEILDNSNGIVIVDEAYIQFSEKDSLLNELEKYDNLIILQTFSKAIGMANIRLGMGFGNAQIISILNKIKFPYNINGLTQNVALKSISNIKRQNSSIKKIIVEKKKMVKSITKFSFVKKVFPSDANFLLVKFDNSERIYQFLLKNQIIVRDRSKEKNCENCLRITIGKSSENKKLISTLKSIERIKD
ncbi:MAG: histidinol-phosphate transaminase [Candidatus Marinimicrobia bacterium]|nr:histidinol-phosphate transaminase [Candidatus Neomarinimicrobiota bacterium]